jgi:hypothetical protein
MFNKKYAIVGEISFEMYKKITINFDPPEKRHHEEAIIRFDYDNKWKNQEIFNPELIEKYGGPVLFPDKDGIYFWWADSIEKKTHLIKNCEIIHVNEIEEKLPEYFI